MDGLTQLAELAGGHRIHISREGEEGDFLVAVIRHRRSDQRWSVYRDRDLSSAISRCWAGEPPDAKEWELP